MADNDNTGLAGMLRWLEEEREEEEREEEEREEEEQTRLRAVSGNLTLEDATLQAAGVVDGRIQELLLGMGIVRLGGQVDEGEIIQAVAIPWDSLTRELERDPDFLHQFDSRKFEEIVAAAYHADGHFDEVVLTPRSGDRGRDVIATKHGRFSIRVLDQVRRYKPGFLVTADEVRAMFGVLTWDRGASKAYVTTTAGFAPGVAVEFADAIPTRLDLRDGAALREWLADLSRRRR